MVTEHLRDRLDRLLTIAENGQDVKLRWQIAFILDIVPHTLCEIQKDILTINKPRIKNLMGRTAPYRKDKCIRELQSHSKREDMLGQISDLIARIAMSSECD